MSMRRSPEVTEYVAPTGLTGWPWLRSRVVRVPLPRCATMPPPALGRWRARRQGFGGGTDSASRRRAAAPRPVRADAPGPAQRPRVGWTALPAPVVACDSLDCGGRGADVPVRPAAGGPWRG